MSAIELCLDEDLKKLAPLEIAIEDNRLTNNKSVVKDFYGISY